VIKSTRVRSRRRYAAAFTALCGLAIPVWWLALFQLPAFRRIFIPVAAWPYFKSVVWFDMSLALLTLTVALQAATGRPAPLLGRRYSCSLAGAPGSRPRRTRLSGR
jgi:hypothetical protein